MIKGLIYFFASYLPKSIVYGKSFRKAKRTHYDFIQSQNKKVYIQEYTHQKLQYVFSIANKCRFYRDKLKDRKIQDQKLIDKGDVLNAKEDIVYTKYNSDLVTTGGTSGKPLAFYINKNRKGTEWYWMTSGWALVGFDYKKSWRAVLRNQSLNGKMYEINPLLKEIYFDNFKLDEQYITFITNEIERRKIEFLHAYPSAAYTVAIQWKRLNSTPRCVRAFLCGSENVLPIQKKLIQEELGIRMFTWFGHSEKLILAHEGATCENFHSIPFYGYAELLDKNNQPVTIEGGIGELVGTGYINTKTPFIRYKTGDYAEFVGDSCPNCGHLGLTFKNIKGRWEGDKIYLSNGNHVTTTALNLHDDIYTQIDGLQYYQEKIGELEVRVIINSGWEAGSSELLKISLKDKIPANLVIEVKIVRELEFSENRKYQLLIQKVKR